MNRENVSMAIGLVLLVLGLVILFFVFFQALTVVQAPETYFDEHFPQLTEEEDQGPSAEFSWNSNGLTVDFQDNSMEGDSSINRWEWDFDDGSTSQQQNPSHTYSDQGNYIVRLTVENVNGERSRARADIYVEPGNNDNGASQRDDGDGEEDSGLGDISLMLAVVVIVLLYFVLFLVGGAILKAGWNLVKPGPSTVKLKIRPKKVETEMEGAAQPYQVSPAYYPQQGGSQPQPTQRAAEKKEYPSDEENLEE